MKRITIVVVAAALIILGLLGRELILRRAEFVKRENALSTALHGFFPPIYFELETMMEGVPSGNAERRKMIADAIGDDRIIFGAGPFRGRATEVYEVVDRRLLDDVSFAYMFDMTTSKGAPFRTDVRVRLHREPSIIGPLRVEVTGGKDPWNAFILAQVRAALERANIEYTVK